MSGLKVFATHDRIKIVFLPIIGNANGIANANGNDTGFAECIKFDWGLIRC